MNVACLQQDPICFFIVGAMLLNRSGLLLIYPGRVEGALLLPCMHTMYFVYSRDFCDCCATCIQLLDSLCKLLSQ